MHFFRRLFAQRNTFTDNTWDLSRDNSRGHGVKNKFPRRTKKSHAIYSRGVTYKTVVDLFSLLSIFFSLFFFVGISTIPGFIQFFTTHTHLNYFFLSFIYFFFLPTWHKGNFHVNLNGYSALEIKKKKRERNFSIVYLYKSAAGPLANEGETFDII